MTRGRRSGWARAVAAAVAAGGFLVATADGCGGSIDPSTSLSDGATSTTDGASADGSLRDGTTSSTQDGGGQDGTVLDGTITRDGGLVGNVGPDGADGADGDVTSFEGDDADSASGFDEGVDSAVPCNSGTCPSPNAVEGFQPTWIPPKGAHQGACTTQLISDFYDQCLSLTGMQTCTDFTPGDAAHQACASCIQSNYGDPSYGPLVYEPDGIVETNLAGCIALLQPDEQPCALSLEAVDECQHAACDPVCNAQTFSNFDEWVACSAQATTCSCQSWFDQSMCTKGIADDAGAATQCLVGKTFEDYYFFIAALFCGT